MSEMIGHDYCRWVLDVAKIRFRNDIKSTKKCPNAGVLGAYKIELKNGQLYLGYFDYQEEISKFIKCEKEFFKSIEENNL